MAGLRAENLSASPFCRSLVLEAFSRRPEWIVEPSVGRVGGVCESSAFDLPDGPSLFHWGEYERIDWSALDTWVNGPGVSIANAHENGQSSGWG